MSFPPDIDGPSEALERLQNLDIEGIMHLLDQEDNVNKPTPGNISLYEIALTKCCTIICRTTADKFQSVQKLLIKHLFSESHIRSMMAADLYLFIMRIVHPNMRKSMEKIIENLCKMAPPEIVVKGEALMNRISSAGLS